MIRKHDSLGHYSMQSMEQMHHKRKRKSQIDFSDSSAVSEQVLKQRTGLDRLESQWFSREKGRVSDCRLSLQDWQHKVVNQT